MVGREPDWRWLLVLGVVLVLALLPSARRAAQARQDGEFKLYLPSSWRGVSREELPTSPPVTAPAQTSATATPTGEGSPTTAPATPTGTAAASNTPTETPPATPTSPVGGSISGRLLLDGEPATIGLGLNFGPALYLRRCTSGGADCTNLDRTGVADSNGGYTFTGVAPLATGEFYQVLWVNEDNPPEMMGDIAYLGTWYGPRIAKFGPGEQVDLPDIELANIELVGPSNGTSFGFPSAPQLQFEWEKRQREVGDFTYRWGICSADSGCCQSVLPRQTAWLTDSLGQSTKWLMTSYPPTVRLGTPADPFTYPYCWFIRIQSQEAYMYGESFYIRKIWFYQTLLALADFGLVRPGDWNGAAPASSSRFAGANW